MNLLAAVLLRMVRTYFAATFAPSLATPSCFSVAKISMWQGLERNAAVRVQATSDSSVCSVGSSSASWSSVYLDVGEDELFGVHIFDLRVCLQVGQEVQHHLDGLRWPSSSGGLPLLGLCGSTSCSSVSSERDHSLVFEDLIEVLLGHAEAHSFKDSRGIVGVLEVSSDVISASLHSCVL